MHSPPCGLVTQEVYQGSSHFLGQLYYVVKKVELEMVWEQSYLNPCKFVTLVWVRLGKSSCVRIYVAALPPVLLSNYEIYYHYKILEVMHNLNVLGLKRA